MKIIKMDENMLDILKIISLKVLELFTTDGNIIAKGQWKNSQLIKGEATQTYQNGNRYEGQVENGLPNGYGTLFDSAGKTVAKGQWRNGTLISATN